MNEPDFFSPHEPAYLSVGAAHARRVAPPKCPRPTEPANATEHASASQPVRVAVSGGIGAGKSTFSDALRPLALAFADADEVARRVVAPGSDGLELIRRRFGDGVLQADGSLDRAALAGIVFSDEEARAELEDITHPRIAAAVRHMLDVPGPGFTVYDVPLLVSAQDGAEFDEVIVVRAPVEERVSRLMERGMSPDDAQRRMDAQISDEDRATLATILVDNTGSAEDLAELATLIAHHWLR